MKKKILIGIGLIFVLLIIVLIYAVIISFKVVKQSTDNINFKLKENFQNIVRVPEVVPPAFRSFEKTTYNWEMITKDQEVTSVSFFHDTGFSRDQNLISATLEMPQGTDPSLFKKVLPAVLSDEQSLLSAQDLEHANLGSNESIGYNKIELVTKENNPNVVTQIRWEFNREKITSGSEQYYNNLYNYSEPVLKTLYSIQRAILVILSP